MSNCYQSKPKTAKSFSVPSWQEENAAFKVPPLQAEEEDAWRDRAYALHTAKKRALASFSRLTNQSKDYRAQEAWAEEERAVLRARAGLLDALLAGDHKLCLKSKHSPARVCVMYNRMRCEADGKVQLGPMQSTMSWVVHGGDKAMQGLITAGEQAGPESLGLMLAAIRRSMPRQKESLKALTRALSLPLPDRLDLDRAGAKPEHTRAMQGGAFRLAWGALDLDVQEAWQNPSTNAAIRRSILETAHQAMREATRTKRPLWSTANYLTIRIVLDDESHNLTLTPFCDSEACTVTHMQFVQSVFDQSGPERGILNLGQNPEAIHAIPLGTVLPLEAYVCLKAHRKSRLNEVQLNYVHSRGLLQHKGFDLALLPAPEGLYMKGMGTGGGMPPTKSTRLSGPGVDVLASSYHLADQVFTTITVVQYPPFGTQFSAKAPPKRYNKALGPPFNPDAPEFNPDEPNDDDYENWSDKGDNHDDYDYEEEEETGDSDKARALLFPNRHYKHPEPDEEEGPGYEQEEYNEWNVGHRPEMDKTSKTGYEIERKQWQLKTNKKGEFMHKSKMWEATLRTGQYYYIDGFFGNPYNPEGRFILFEVDNGNAYRDAQAKAIQIRNEIIQRYKEKWIPKLSFYDNLKKSPAIQDLWRYHWSEFLYSHVKELEEEYNLAGKGPDRKPRSFWYTKNNNNWIGVFKKDMTKKDNDLLKNPKNGMQFDPESKFGQKMLYFTKKPQEWLNFWKSQDKIHPVDAHSIINANRPFFENKLAGGQIPIPRVLSSRPALKGKDAQDAVKSLQTRICALETKLEKAQTNKNTQYLLQKVLERLEC